MNRMYFLLVIFFIISCDKTEITTTIFHNETNHDLEIKYFNFEKDFENSIDITRNSKEEIKVFNDNAGKLPPAVAITADSCRIIFDDGKVLVYTKNISPTELSILREEDYNYLFEDTRKADLYNYDYFITDEHYEKAQ